MGIREETHFKHFEMRWKWNKEIQVQISMGTKSVNGKFVKIILKKQINKRYHCHCRNAEVGWLSVDSTEKKGE